MVAWSSAGIPCCCRSPLAPTTGSVSGLRLASVLPGRRFAWLVLGPVELVQQVLEAVGNPLADHVVVNSLQDIAELVAGLRGSGVLPTFRDWGVRMHCRLWPQRPLLVELRPNRPLRFGPNRPLPTDSTLNWLVLFHFFYCPRSRSLRARGPLRAHRTITSCKTIGSGAVELFSRRAVFGPVMLMGNEREGSVPHSTAVAQYLPFLRRYARALTGSQASGDAYVAATLEALIADREIIEDPRGARVALYRLFTKIWNSVAVNGATTAPQRLRCRASKSSPTSRRFPARRFCWSRSKAFRSRMRRACSIST